uniref:Uncharacterized protein n=1 Tax=Cyanoderma ruficeps TaxID=181631 RepID=A0A8C3QN38_9PASS
MEAPAICTEPEFYQQNFDPQEYLKEFYSMSSSREGASAFMMRNLRILQEMFSLVNGLRGDTLIEVSCGPTTCQLLANCWELEKWLKNDAGAFDWEPVVKGTGKVGVLLEKWAEKQEKRRKKVKQVLKRDVNKANPMSLPTADCFISTLCLEGACKDLATFCSQAFSCLCLQKQEVEEAVVAAGFEVKFSVAQPYTVDNDHMDLRGVPLPDRSMGLWGGQQC